MVCCKNPVSIEILNNLKLVRTYGVLLLLDLEDGAVLEGPPDDVGLLASALDELGRAEGGPELAEVLDLDEVPDVGERGTNDGRLADGGGGRDGRHFGWYWCDVGVVVFGCKCR